MTALMGGGCLKCVLARTRRTLRGDRYGCAAKDNTLGPECPKVRSRWKNVRNGQGMKLRRSEGTGNVVKDETRLAEEEGSRLLMILTRDLAPESEDGLQQTARIEGQLYIPLIIQGKAEAKALPATPVTSVTRATSADPAAPTVQTF